MKRNSDRFVDQYQDKINELANQDSVRLVTIAKEREDGTMKGLIQERVYMAMTGYQEALSQGFEEDKAFMIGCYEAGYLANN